MEYEIAYVNPSHVHRCDHVSKFNGKANARAFVQQARQYPGSIEIESIAKITPKGVRTTVYTDEF